MSNCQKLDWIAEVVANPPEGCAIWPFGVNSHGYCHVTHNGKTRNAHRVALIILSGEDPAGLVAAHGPCHNRACINPLHVSWKTKKENALDRLRDGTALGPYRTSPSLPNCLFIDCLHKVSLGDYCWKHYRQISRARIQSEILDSVTCDPSLASQIMRVIKRKHGSAYHGVYFRKTLDKLARNNLLVKTGSRYQLGAEAKCPL